MWMWFSLALAAGPKLGVLEMPLTPADGVPEYMGLAAFTGADGDWLSSADGFHCKGVGDLVEVTVRADDFPSEIPARVTCARDADRVSVKVKIDDRRLAPAIVRDGTLVMPRAKRNGAIYRGPVPTTGLKVGSGKSSQLELKCKVEPGDKLYVSVDADSPDGDGVCKLPTSSGGTFLLPVVVRTVKGAHREHE